MIKLPYPPSYNRYWRNGTNGGYISAEGRSYKQQAQTALLREKRNVLEGDVRIFLKFYRPRKSGDLDNRIKQVLDSLQGICYTNDSQIVEIHAFRFEDKTFPRVEIEVEKV